MLFKLIFEPQMNADERG